MAPWADAMFAMDRMWWEQHANEVKQVFKGERFTTGILPARYDVKRFQRTEINGFQNSGAAAVEMAVMWGAKKVVMLGYDCQRTNGEAHWHGDHPSGLGNAGSITKWPAHFRNLYAKVNKSADVVNCSRATALNVFRRSTLKEELCCD